MVWSDFQLAHDLDAAVDEVEHLVERGHGLSLPGIGAGEVGEGHGGDRAGEVGSAVEGVVVEEDGDAIGAEVEIDLHGDSTGEGGAHASERVGGRLSGGGGVGR